MTRALMLLLLVTVAICAKVPSNVTHWKVGNYMGQENANKPPLEINIYTPNVAGIYPVVLFSTGFGGVAPAFAYEDIEYTLSERGVVVITIAKLHNMNADEMLDLFNRTYYWIAENIDSEFKKRFHAVIPDYEDNLFFLSHSWGGLITTRFLMNGCGNKMKLKGQIMMDPIDGYRWNKPVLHPPEPVNFTIPAIIIAHGKVYGKKPTDWCFPSFSVMAPTYYAAYKGPTWVVNFTDYGHRDNVQTYIIKILNMLDCPGC